MYVYIKDTVASHIDTVDTKENTYIKGDSGFILTVYTVCAMYAKGVERSSKYTIRVVMLFLILSMSKVSKEAQKTVRMEPLCPFMYTQIR